MANETVPNPAAPFLARRERNLHYFQKHYPHLYRFFRSYKMQQLQLNILTETDEVDLLEKGVSLYNHQAKKYAKKEVEKFRSVFHEGVVVQTVNPTFAGSYHHPRFAHRAVDRLLHRSPLQKAHFRGYRLRNYYPMIVFLGLGLGYQVEHMINAHAVENALIVEPDTDVFAASLYAIDWVSVCEQFSVDKGRTLHFLVGIEKNEDMLWGAVWNELIQRCPVFPALTLFFVHRGNKLFNSVADRINKEMHLFLGSWGHYDDEIRQLNNALHTFHQNIPIIPDHEVLDPNLPVAIVGSGPSLDARLTQITKYREKMLVVSAGTGLKPLLDADITPDFHVELESDAVVYKVLTALDLKKLKQVRLIAPSHVCPKVWSLFSNYRYYFKKESAIGASFGQEGEILADGTPTCTNAAFVIARHLGGRTFFLFGLDYGFHSAERHHSKSAYYYNLPEGAPKAKKIQGRNNLLPEYGVHGEEMFTRPIYYSSRRKLELAMGDALTEAGKYNFYSCSDGARIEHTTWLSQAAFESQMADASTNLDMARLKSVEKVFSPTARRVDVGMVNEELMKTRKALKVLGDEIEDLFKSRKLEGDKDCLRLALRVNTYAQKVLQEMKPGFYYMVRGTLWHFLYAGLTHALAIEDKDARRKFLRVWEKAIVKTFQQLPDHFKAVTNKTFDIDSDPWVLQRIGDEEKSPGEWFDKAGVKPPEGVTVIQ
ncbi:DUF115 domain-containing protein [Marinobacteraceae bacterium S3BR75-40.1]